MDKRVCCICGKTYQPVRVNQVTCSDKCRKERQKERYRECEERKRAGLPPINTKRYPPRACQICGEEFMPHGANAVICGKDECRKAHRKATRNGPWSRERRGKGKKSELRVLMKQLTKEGKTYAEWQRGETAERMRGQRNGGVLG